MIAIIYYFNFFAPLDALDPELVANVASHVLGHRRRRSLCPGIT